MSWGAVYAYDQGEKPRSKWTKATILSAIQGKCREYGLEYDPEVGRLRKAELWDEFIVHTSWHHTGRYATRTDFYSVDDDRVLGRFSPATE